MPGQPEQEFERLKQAFKRREQRRPNVLIAVITDVSPRAEHGYILGQLKDGTTVNIHVWTTDTVTVGHAAFVIPFSNEPWNWYVLIGVNASADPERLPFTQNLLASAALPAHTLASHSGTLAWQAVDTTASKVDLASQVTGLLPVAQQTAQAELVTLTATTPAIGSGATATGSLALGGNCLYVRRLTITNGTACQLTLAEPDGTVQYQTTDLGMPFVDTGGFVLADPTGSGTALWSVTNRGAVSAAFALTLAVIRWQVRLS